MFKPISKLLILGLAAIALLITGCGGSGSSDDTLTKAEFIKKADALCSKADKREAGEFLAYARKNPSAVNDRGGKGMEEALRTIWVPSVRKQVEEMKALGIPEGDEKELEKFFDEVDAALEKAEKDPLSIEENLPKKNPMTPPSKLGEAYGFQGCAELY